MISVQRCFVVLLLMHFIWLMRSKTPVCPAKKFKLKVGAFGAEPWTEQMRHEIEEKLGIKAYDIYGLSEIAGPGVGVRM